MDAIFTAIIGAVDPTVLVIVLFLSQAAGKLIPDTATGFFGVLRKVFKVVGLYVSNRKDDMDSA